MRPPGVLPAPARGRSGLLTAAAIAFGAAVVGAGLNLLLALVVGRAFGPADTGVFFAVIGLFLVLANILKLGADTGLVRGLARLVALDRPRLIPTTLLVAMLPVGVIAIMVAALVVALIPAIGDASVAGGLTGGFAGGDPGGGVGGDPGGGVGGALGLDPGGRSLLASLTWLVPILTLLFVVTAATRGLGGIVPYALLQNVLLPASRLAGVAIAAVLGWSVGGAVLMWGAGLPALLLVAAVVLAGRVRRTLADADACTKVDAVVDLAADAGADAGADVETEADLGAGAPARTSRRDAAVEFWGFAAPRAGSAAIEITLEWADVVLVAVLAGPAEAGLYAIATRCVKVATIADHALRVTVSPRLSAAFAMQRTDLVQRLYQLGTELLVAVVWPFLVVLTVFGDQVMRLFGHGFSDGGRLPGILAVGMATMVAAGSLQSILLLSGLSMAQLGNKVVTLGVCLGMNVLLTPRWGATGAAVAWVLMVLTDTALAANQVRRRLGIRLFPAPVVRAAVASFGCVGAAAVAVRVLAGPSLAALVLAGLVGSAALALLAVRTGAPARLRQLAQTGGPP